MSAEENDTEVKRRILKKKTERETEEARGEGRKKD